MTKTNRILIAATGFFIFSMSIAIAQVPNKKRPVDYVNPLIGTHNSRWELFPGAGLPYGMVKLSPDNQDGGWKAGYEYNVKTIAGFSHIHSWTMCGILTMPSIGPLKIIPGSEKHPENGYRSKFSHSTEQARPGYYSVMLDDYGIRAELTSTTRTGVQRYTFPKNDSARILIDLQFPSEYGAEISWWHISKVSDREIKGFVYQQSLRKANFNDYVVNFVMRFSKPFKSFNGWVDEDIYRNIDMLPSDFRNADVGAFVEFSTEDQERITVQTGISLVSMEQAEINLDTEMKPYNGDFDAVRKGAEDCWNTLLSKIEVEGGTEENKTKFYTNLYRAYAARSIWSDVNGKYIDMNEKVQQLPDSIPYVLGGDGFWMTFWNLNQLWALMTPRYADNWVKSLIEMSEKGGWLPEGPTGIEYSGIMQGSHEISLIVSSYQKGIRDFNADKAWKAIKKIQTEPGRYHESGGFVGNRNYESYLKLGYVPDEEGPVSNTMEFAFDDWTAGQFALARGDSAEYKYFTKRAFNYEKVFDTNIGYVHRKHADGTWVGGFSPFGQVAWQGSGYVEGNAWQYSYFVPHDLNGLINLMGKDEFNNRLEAGFEKSLPYNFNSENLGTNSLDGMGILPVNHGNQPNMEAAYLFNYSGKPWLTQKWVREIMDLYYGSTPEHGWLGDEDEGQMGAWFVMSAIGLFEMTGGSDIRPIYEIGGPLFERVTIRLDSAYYPGKTFVIEARKTSGDNRYIQSAVLNGKTLNKPWFYHSELIKGGSLVLNMGPVPNKFWGSSPASAPPSLSSILDSAQKATLKAYDKDAEALDAWNKAMKAYYYHKKGQFEILPVEKDEIIFLGNSITDQCNWSELLSNPKVKNRGIGGDDTDGVLERLSEITNRKPAKIFIMIGTNDISYGKSIEHVIANYKTIMDRIKNESPATKLYVQSILPTDDAIHITRKNSDISMVNTALETICRERGLVYIDLYSHFIRDGKKLNPAYSLDGLHLNGQGYLLWRELIKQYVNE
jgi:predicted alpha-1,2-mannosidase